MTDRFNLSPVFRGQWKSLSQGSGEGARPDWVARAAVFGVPLVAGVTGGVARWQLASPGVLLTAVALLAGTSLAVFAQLSTLRLKLTEWRTSRGSQADDVDKEALDESVAHLLAATMVCLIDVVVLVVGIMATPTPDHPEPGAAGPPLPLWASTVAITLSAYIALVMVMLIPRLYSAYNRPNHVAEHLDGSFVDRTRSRWR